MYGSAPTCLICGAKAIMSRGTDHFCSIDHSKRARDFADQGIDTESYYTGYDNGIRDGRIELYNEVEAAADKFMRQLGSHDARCRHAIQGLMKQIKLLKACDTFLEQETPK